ncbi:MAG TPA: lamin tail domain-containing protein [Verrucomicrobiota bacterium]|nr:lamin tail domain-containing protein [Verrucomicrobiota bacterium]HNT15046.1 lamin tail domain-containing protein [Verrucomicrobiota bacterium]
MRHCVFVWLHLLLGLLPLHSEADVLITEFLAANKTGLQDEDLATSDWIEIHNASELEVDLAGWRLTDDPSQPDKWTFPATNLPARGFLVLFASGKNRTVPGQPLHANFSLSAAGEYLALITPAGAISSEYAPAFPPQFNDISYGLTPTNTDEQTYFAVATPGATNATSYYTRVAEPQISPGRGFYSNTLSVVMTSATPATVIRYTLDGSVPTSTTGTLYVSPLTITNTAVVRAVAFLADATTSVVATHTYIFPELVPQQSPDGQAPPGWPSSWGNNTVDYGMDPNIVDAAPWSGAFPDALLTIPSLSIVLPLGSLFNSSTGIYANATQDGLAWERAASMELLDPENNPAREFQSNIGLRIRGGFSRSPANPKHSFRVFFRSEYGASRLSFPFFGTNAATSFEKFDLRSNQDDSWHFTGTQSEILRDAFSRDTMLDMGALSPHGNYYHLYLNGQYWGLYTSEERPEANFGSSYLGGDADNYDTVKVDADADYTVFATDGDLGAWRRLWEAATNGFASLEAYQMVQGRNPDGTPNPAYENLLDVPALIDYMLVIIYTGNIDAPVSNYLGNHSPNNWFGIRERSGNYGGFRFLLHDSENSLYNLTDNRTGPFPAGDPAQGSSFSKSNPHYLWQQLSANAEFRLLVADRVQKHFFNGGALTAAALTNRYQARRSEIDQAVIAESARWGDAKREPAFTQGDWRYTSDKLLTNYFRARVPIVLNQLRAKNLFPTLGAPQMNQFGGNIPAGFPLTLSHTNPAGTIYFTTDGSDPRQPGGAVGAAAQMYDIAVPIFQPTLIRTRVKDGEDWSPLVEATFAPPQDLSQLVVTEVMYNPLPWGGFSGNDLEFIELKNMGTNTLDLSKLAFTVGISATFPDNTFLPGGGFALLARNATAFALRYPGVAIQATYTGQLDNSGEKITLSFPDGGTLFSLEYGDRAPWPIACDGFGFSLVPKQPGLAAAPDNGARWRASSQIGGSPGADDPDPQIPAIVINEVLAHTDPPLQDAIELYNPTATTVDIGSWFLSDDPTSPQKYRIPPDTLIPAGGYVVFYASQFNAGTDGNTPFLLASTGEQVYLTSGAGDGTLTGYSHGFSFGATFNGTSLGRYVNSAGQESFPLQQLPSLGQPNAGPRIGPVIINEIHYHPATGDDEFIELLNIGDTAVPLFDPAAATNAWRISAPGYTLPTGLSLPPASLLLLVSSDPEAFRLKYAVSPEVPILGPYATPLPNGGARISLEQPDVPNPDLVPYVSVEAVQYNDKSPWPVAADGSGPSLQRTSAIDYGNDPVLWLAATPTPGRLLPTADSDGDGLPDAWELAHGTDWKRPDATEDPDGDGFTNFEEFLCGTLPLDPDSALRLELVSAAPAPPQLRWEAAAGRTYHVLAATSLAAANWTTFAEVASAATNRLVEIPVPASGEAAQFFQLVIPTVP